MLKWHWKSLSRFSCRGGVANIYHGPMCWNGSPTWKHSTNSAEGTPNMVVLSINSYCRSATFIQSLKSQSGTSKESTGVLYLVES